MSVFVDSDILIEIARSRNGEIVDRWRKVAASGEAVLCSPVSVAELWHGSRPSEVKILNDLFANVICVPINAETGRLAGAFLSQFRKSHSLELGDALIAAGSIQSGVPLWTRNRKHFPMKDLRLF